MAAPRVLIAIVVVSRRAGPGPVSAQDDDAPLRLAAGPYRGVVVDVHTASQPLPAAVIILWQRADEQVRGLRRLSGVREVFIDGKGEFVHDVGSLERRRPPSTFAPRMVIVRPGYAPHPGRSQRVPPGSRPVDSPGPERSSGSRRSQNTRIAPRPSTPSSRC